MAFRVQELARPSGESTFYDPTFRTMIEVHLPILRSTAISRRATVSADKVYQYEADFYGLLAEMNIPVEHHWIYLRTNGFDSPMDFGTKRHNPYAGDLSFTIILPSAEMIQELVTLYKTTRT